MVYDISETRLQAHRIKPALFDLFLGLAITAYGFLWYLSVLVSCFMYHDLCIIYTVMHMHAIPLKCDA